MVWFTAIPVTKMQSCLLPLILKENLSLYLALKLPLGKITVMHLVARETLPEPNSQGNYITEILFFFVYMVVFKLHHSVVHLNNWGNRYFVAYDRLHLRFYVCFGTLNN